MADEKENTLEGSYEVDRSPIESPTAIADGYGSNNLDNANMKRMGKDQEMKRVFRQLSLISFTAIIMGTWQWELLSNTQGLNAGGRAGMFWYSTLSRGVRHPLTLPLKGRTSGRPWAMVFSPRL